MGRYIAFSEPIGRCRITFYALDHWRDSSIHLLGRYFAGHPRLHVDRRQFISSSFRCLPLSPYFVNTTDKLEQEDAHGLNLLFLWNPLHSVATSRKATYMFTVILGYRLGVGHHAAFVRRVRRAAPAVSRSFGCAASSRFFFQRFTSGTCCKTQW